MRSTAAIALKRHQIIVDLWGRGYNGPAIARNVGISVFAVHHHIKNRCRCGDRWREKP